MSENVLNIRNKGPRVREFINENSGRPEKDKIGCDGIVIDAIILILKRLAEILKKEINEDNVTKVLEKYCLDWRNQDLESLFYHDKEIKEYFGLNEEDNKKINIAMSSYMREIIQKSAKKEWAVNDFISMPHLEFGLGLYHYDPAKYLNKNQYKNRRPLLNFYKLISKEVGNMFYQSINPSQIANELLQKIDPISKEITDKEIEVAVVAKIEPTSEINNKDQIKQIYENDPQFIQILAEIKAEIIKEIKESQKENRDHLNQIESKVDSISFEITINAETLEKILNHEQNQEQFLRNKLGSDFEKIRDDWQALRGGSISKMEFFGKCAQKVGKLLMKSIISQVIPV